MSIVTIKLTDVKSENCERPRKCPYCEGEIFQRWGQVSKAIRDQKVKEVVVYRYRCCRCHKTFRHYPEGIDRKSQSQRLRKVAAIMWILGLSYRSLEIVLDFFGVKLSRMSGWRDVQERSGQLFWQQIHKKVRVIGLDVGYVRGMGETQPVMVAVDMGDGLPITIGYVDEKDPKAVKRFLEPLVQHLGVSVVVTDDLMTYRTVTGQLDLEHQVCQFHLRRWVGRTLRELRQTVPEVWQEVVDEIQEIIDELPIDGERRLFQLWKQIPENRQGRKDEPYSPLDQLRHLIIRLAENWKRYRVFDWDKEVPWTNNLTEQAIGRMKMRSRTVRGYKSKRGMLNALMLAGMGLC
jgi:transposase-like protein